MGYGAGYCGGKLVGGVGKGAGGGGDKFKSVVLHARLEPYTKVQVYCTTLLSA